LFDKLSDYRLLKDYPAPCGGGGGGGGGGVGLQFHRNSPSLFYSNVCKLKTLFSFAVYDL
jgi:hypothetical protein